MYEKNNKIICKYYNWDKITLKIKMSTSYYIPTFNMQIKNYSNLSPDIVRWIKVFGENIILKDTSFL